MGTKQSKYGNDCIIVSPNAGLGNQLFQIANGYALSKRNNKNCNLITKTLRKKGFCNIDQVCFFI